MMEEIKKNIMSKTTDYIQNEEEQERAGGNGGENGEAGGKSSSEEKQEKAAILRRQHSSKTIVLRRQWGLLGQIMLLVIMAVAYFAFVYLFAVNNINKGAGTARSVDWAGRRRVLTALMFTEARRAVVYPFLNDPHRAASQQVHIDNALAHTDFFLFVSNSVLYGNPDAELDPVTGISEDLDQLMFRNACPLIKTPNCETFHRGVMQQGMTAALAEYARLIQNLVFRAQQVANGTVADARAVFFTEDYLDAETMFWDHFLNTGLLKMAELLTTNAIDGMNSAFSLLTSTFAAFFSVSYVLLLFLYDPLVKRLNFQLQRTRAMLLMIPTSVIEENRALRRKLLQAKF
jgi:ABC-type sugar transport system permease subunit